MYSGLWHSRAYLKSYVRRKTIKILDSRGVPRLETKSEVKKPQKFEENGYKLETIPKMISLKPWPGVFDSRGVPRLCMKPEIDHMHSINKSKRFHRSNLSQNYWEMPYKFNKSHLRPRIRVLGGTTAYNGHQSPTKGQRGEATELTR